MEQLITAEEASLIAAAIAVLYTLFALIDHNQCAADFWKIGNANLFHAALFVVATSTFLARDPSAAGALAPLALISGLAVGRMSRALAGTTRGRRLMESESVPLGLVAPAAVLALWDDAHRIIFHESYPHRWSGPWRDPNVYGLSMAAGVVAALTAMRSNAWGERRRSTRPAGWWRSNGRVILMVFVLALVLRGLLHSYSRGAWLAALVGSATLLADALPNDVLFEKRSRSALTGRRRWITRLGIAGMVCAGLNWLCWAGVPQRLLLTLDQSDFSWRNRLSSWVGAASMMRDHPVVGVGWGHVEMAYERLYMPIGTTSGAAIETNDYLMIGCSLGPAALLLFVVTVMLSCRSNVSGKDDEGTRHQAEAVQVMLGRAIASVLLCGMWTNGILMTIPLGWLFWISIGVVDTAGSARIRKEPVGAT